MKTTLCVVAGLLSCGTAVAGPGTFVEVAVVDGGENGRNGTGDQFGFEAAGDFGLGDHWYVGGVLGRFNRDLPGGDMDNTYLNAHGGYQFSVAEDTGLNLEAGLWFGAQDNDGSPDTDPRALELKAGVNQTLSEKFDIFGTLAWVAGDLDTPQDDNLRNYVWSLGGAYAFGEIFSVNLRIVNGVNGVNGQDQVLRLAGRWTF